MDGQADSTLTRDDLLALLNTANQLNSVATLESALMNILQLAGNLSASTAGSVILHDPERNDLYFAAATGPAAATLPDIRIPVGKGKAGQVFATGVPLIENDLQNHYAAVDQKTEFSTKSMICIPLRQGDRIHGVMQILNKADGREPYDARDLELLTLFGAQATAAIRNATMFEQMLASSGLYATPAVRQDLIERLTGRGRSAIRERFTVVFADMRGFSQLCNMVAAPEKIQAVLSDYVLLLGAIILRHEGILNKVVGDGVLAIFRGDRAADNAVNSALDIVDGFARLRSGWKSIARFNLDFLDIGVGITTDDEIVLGTIGDDRLRDFTVIGAGVNLAAALVKTARGERRILCDHATLERLSERSALAIAGPDQFRFDKPGPLQGVSYDVYHLRKAEDAAPTSAAAPAQYDVFFSYRREGGSEVARSVQQALKDEYRIFLDVDRLPSGHFDAALLRTIETAPNFVVFLSPGGLERCSHADDWLRKEIAHAIGTKRNIVPIMLPGFAFPDPATLADDVADVVRHDAVEYSHRYFYAMLDKLREHLVSPADHD